MEHYYYYYYYCIITLLFLLLFWQVLANRPDIIREDYMNELCILQDDVPPFPNKVLHWYLWSVQWTTILFLSKIELFSFKKWVVNDGLGCFQHYRRGIGSTTWSYFQQNFIGDNSSCQLGSSIPSYSTCHRRGRRN